MTLTQVDTTPQETWQIRAARKQASRLASIPAAWRLDNSKFPTPSTEKPTNAITLDAPRKSGILSDNELDITENYTAGELLKKLADGTFSAAEVTLAFSKRAAIAQQLVNCLTETFFDFASQRAQFLDDYLKTHKKPFGPLHGLPDSFRVKGYDSTIGYTSFIDRPAAENSPLVDILLNLGAVLYVKTNIPQTLMTADSDNYVWGRVLNPHKTTLGAGGSSGGEGALIAMRGSLIGVGTDVGGSIRIPALCNGDYGFKPSTHRIPYGGQATPGLPGAPTGVPACAGPLATAFEDCELFMKAVIGAHPWNYDATAHAVPWRTLKPPKTPLTIGLLTEDPEWPLHPPVRHTLAKAANELRAAGHEIVELPHDPDMSVSTAQELTFAYFSLDPIRTAVRHIEAGGEPLIPSARTMVSKEYHERYVAKHKYTIDGLAALNVETVAYRNKWRAMWIKRKLDCIIGPGAQGTAVPHDKYGMVPYTVLWNLLDYPATIIPYSKASKELDPNPVKFSLPARGPDYDPEAADGAPCAIQITTPHFQDEECIAVAGIINQDLLGSCSRL
ncbi:MAG: hypothetical protein M1834_008811 [Cirrosporium novae-zelandiae]|nr:MAG: hypothetical protein M1834_008811 [Cirrosporium novae-zelandiae]